MKDRKEAARAEARLGEVSTLARCINRRGFDTRADLGLAPDATVEQVKEKCSTPIRRGASTWPRSAPPPRSATET